MKVLRRIFVTYLYDIFYGTVAYEPGYRPPIYGNVIFGRRRTFFLWYDAKCYKGTIQMY